MSTLTATHVTHRFGGLTALDDVSLTLQTGKVHAVIGTNGAGKSTLVSILAGELAPDAGRILLNDADITRWSQPRRAQAGMGRSYQRSAIFPALSVYENCRIAAQAKHPYFWRWFQSARQCQASDAAAHRALALAGLEGEAPRTAGLLSHGAKRQLEIAMSLATRPTILLLDEPLAGMGAQESERMLALLASLKAEHAILLIEHDMDAVFRIADEITVMVNGGVIAHGSPERIRQDPQVQRAYLGEEDEIEADRRPGAKTASGGSAARAAGERGGDMSARPAAPKGAKAPSGGSAARAAGKRGGDIPALIDVQGLHTHYGASHVLHGVDLSIRPGESVGLLGRNGMGKTTLIRTIMGLVPPTRGQIHYCGNGGASRISPHRVARMGIAFVPEGRGIFPNLDVCENLLVAARPGVGGRQDWPIDRVLQTFPRLRERLQHGGQALSGGEQQMLAIGRALMTNPDVLILDEATEGLAPMMVAEIWRIIGVIRQTGVATLIVDRNYRKVLAHTDRCIVLEKGRVVRADDSAALAGNTDVLTRYLGV